MTSKGHRKHTKLTKPDGGRFHRAELGLISAPCSYIEDFVKKLRDQLKDIKIAYADAKHDAEQIEGNFAISYSDKIDHHSLAFQDQSAEYSSKAWFESAELCLVNANHFLTEDLIVFIHPKKEASLERKLDKLKQIRLFVLTEGVDDVYDFVKERRKDWDQVPVVKMSEFEKILAFVKAFHEASIPKLNALVLAGGKSSRMGEDKGQINYHGKEQREYLADLLKPLVDEVYLSAGAHEFQSAYPVIKDSFFDLGPYGGILSAFRHDPNCAWLVVATDIPLLDEASLRFLVKNRNSAKMASAFHNEKSGFPEPLITIWEPRAYKRLLHFLSEGYSCPRKVLINSEVEELAIPKQGILTNVNTPEDLEQVKAQLEKISAQ